MYFLRYPMMGLPPLTRGVLTVMISVHFYSRITPACAGSTLLVVGVSAIYRDHPRLRGEYTEIRSLHMSASGSPPLARGVRMLHAKCCAAERITPACAGSTFPISNKVINTEDHPRLRGEYQEPVHMYHNN